MKRKVLWGVAGLGVVVFLVYFVRLYDQVIGWQTLVLAVVMALIAATLGTLFVIFSEKRQRFDLVHYQINYVNNLRDGEYQVIGLNRQGDNILVWLAYRVMISHLAEDTPTAFVVPVSKVELATRVGEGQAERFLISRDRTSGEKVCLEVHHDSWEKLGFPPDRDIYQRVAA